jgi:hypothetical protein
MILKSYNFTSKNRLSFRWILLLAGFQFGIRGGALCILNAHYQNRGIVAQILGHMAGILSANGWL